ncbi:MAG: hypothetical protein N2505_03540, partial [Endomicrobia bacterium]|nr:hypothetical protein [Endomicrobiia bacterium]
DINKLRKEEAEIFGSSDEKIGKSKFSIKLKLIEEIKKDNFRNFIIQQNNNYQGLEYLFYSTFMQNRKRQYYDVGTKFIITFLSKELK